MSSAEGSVTRADGREKLPCSSFLTLLCYRPAERREGSVALPGSPRGIGWQQLPFKGRAVGASTSRTPCVLSFPGSVNGVMSTVLTGC